MLQLQQVVILESRMCCSALQCVVVFVVCCSVLQCVALCCSDGGNAARALPQLQQVESVVCCSVLLCVLQLQQLVCCSVLQCVEVRCSVLQCVAMCCSVLLCVSQFTIVSDSPEAQGSACCQICYGSATNRRLLKIISLSCKRAL